VIIEQSSELPTITLPTPDEREWKQELRRFQWYAAQNSMNWIPAQIRG
jgi:hypothetical protein